MNSPKTNVPGKMYYSPVVPRLRSSAGQKRLAQNVWYPLAWDASGVVLARVLPSVLSGYDAGDGGQRSFMHNNLNERYSSDIG